MSTESNRTVGRTPYDLPTLTLRKRLELWAFSMKWRAKIRWLRAVAPHKLHPETLTSYDGEPPYFVRADLAGTREDVARYLSDDFGLPVEEIAGGMKPIDTIERVWMREHENVACPNPDDCEDDDCAGHEEEGWYDNVDAGTKGAVTYWRWDW